MADTRIINLTTLTTTLSSFRGVAYSARSGVVYIVMDEVLEVRNASLEPIPMLAFDMSLIPEAEYGNINSIAFNGNNILVIGAIDRFYTLKLKQVTCIPISPPDAMDPFLDDGTVSGVRQCVYNVVQEVNCLGQGPGNRKAMLNEDGIVSTYSGMLPFDLKGDHAGGNLVMKFKITDDKYLDIGSMIVDVDHGMES